MAHTTTRREFQSCTVPGLYESIHRRRAEMACAPDPRLFDADLVDDEDWEQQAQWEELAAAGHAAVEVLADKAIREGEPM
jgi:hypothetical protein